MFSIIKKKFVKSTTHMFPKKPALTFNGKGSHNSLISKIVSILISLTVFSLIIVFASELWLKNKPTIVINTEKSEAPPSLVLNNTNFAFAYNLVDSKKNENINSSKEFESRAILVTYNILSNGTTNEQEVELNFTKCSELMGHMVPEINEYLDDEPEDNKPGNNLYQIMCLDLRNISIHLSSPNQKYGKSSDLIIYFYGCENPDWETSKRCEPISDLKNNPMINFYIYEMMPSLKNYSNPYNFIVKEYWDYLDSSTRRNGVLTFKNAYIETDEGLITNSIKSAQLPLISSFDKYFSIKNNKNDLIYDSNVFYHLKLELSNEVVHFKRSYIKIPLVLAQVLSINKLVLIVIKFLIGLFTKRTYQEFFINKCLEINVDNDAEKKEKKNKISNKEIKTDDKTLQENKNLKEKKKELKIIEMKQKNPENNKNDLPLKADGKNESRSSSRYLMASQIDIKPVENNQSKLNLKDKSEKKSKEKDKEKKLQFSICETLHIVCLEKCCQKKTISKKDKLFKNAFKNLKMQYDVHTLIKENLNLKIIFDILLNSSQQIFFNFFKKPVFDGKQYTVEEKLKKDDQHNEKLFDQLRDYYQNCKKTDKLTKIDEMLLNMLKEKDKIKIQEDDKTKPQNETKIEKNNESLVQDHEKHLEADSFDVNQSGRFERPKICEVKDLFFRKSTISPNNQDEKL